MKNEAIIKQSEALSKYELDQIKESISHMQVNTALQETNLEQQ